VVASTATAAPGFVGWATRLWSRGRDHRSMADAVLLKRAAQQDEPACRELLRRHGPRLCAVVEATHRDAGLAEDVVQETFVRAIQRVDQLRDEAQVFPWLVRIALRLAIDQRRKTRREASLHEDWDAPARPEEGPEYRLASRQDARLVERAVARLPKYPRELVALRYFAHLSSAELAEVFGKSEVAIRKDLQRARARLKEILLPWVDDEVTS